MRQRKLIGVVLAGVVASTGVGWAAGSRMKSPAQVAAETAPPRPSLITAPVEKRALSSRVTTRGTVRYGEPQAVTLAASTLGAGGGGGAAAGGGGGGGSSLVTKPPEKGAILAENSVAMEVAGRPVRVLTGAVPMYRDLRPGDAGADVLQLEQALARLGHRPGKVDGTYDSATEGAVDAWYAASGYQAQGPTDTQREALRTARQGVSRAEDQLLQAQDAFDKAQKAVTAKDVAMAEAEVRGARRDLAKARDDLDAARADLSAAQAAETRARADEERLRAEGAPPEAVAEASAAVRQAADAVTKAARAVPEAARMVDAAADKLAVAEASLAATRQPPDTATPRAQVAKARRDLAEANRHLSELDGEVGVVVPANEVLFFPNLPLRVDEPKVKRGDDGTKEVMVVTTSRLAIDASVSIPDAKLVKVGDKVAVVSTELGIEVAGVVTKLADKPGTNGVDAQKVYMEVVPDNAPPELTGAAVRLTIAVESTDGEVLAVPVSALSMGPDGTSRVQVDTGGGATRTVPVEPGLSAEGYVEIRPKGSSLATGDRVVVGKAGRT
ncbi:MAG TPA: peptidoglycan-binding protein [Acidimicrobiales bacterium]|nr:peptidoglycan-binding protein [Acidimicrobiales bacterium]